MVYLLFYFSIGFAVTAFYIAFRKKTSPSADREVYKILCEFCTFLGRCFYLTPVSYTHLVRDSYKEPVYTYETNVIGTVNILECVRLNPCVKSFLNVTTDKVYENREWEYGYREVDRLDGYDPYSNSKSCSELVTHSYRKYFFAAGHLSLIPI